MEQTVIRERFALVDGIDQPRPKTLEQVAELIVPMCTLEV